MISINKILIFLTLFAILLLYFSKNNNQCKKWGRIMLLPLVIYFIYNYYPTLFYFISIANNTTY